MGLWGRKCCHYFFHFFFFLQKSLLFLFYTQRDLGEQGSFKLITVLLGSEKDTAANYSNKVTGIEVQILRLELFPSSMFFSC